MRPKFVIALILGAALIVTLALLAKLQFSKPSPKSVVETVSTTTPTESPLPPLPAPMVQPSVPMHSNPSMVAKTGLDDRDAKIGAEIMRINNVIGNHDTNSEALIMSELTNSEQEVRDQAVAAVKQTGDRDLIPALTNLAASTEDYEQRHALLDAANFLAMPTLAEEQEQQSQDPNATPVSNPPKHRHGSARLSQQTGQQRNSQQIVPANPNVGDPNAMQNN